MYYLGNVPNPTCSATDSTSGLAAACSGQLSGGLANGVGTYTYTANAVDLAGNTTTLAYTFRVIYRFDGFLQPINDTAHQVGLQSSQFKAGSTVPAKFQLKKADGTIVTPTAAPQWLTPTQQGPTSGAAPTAPALGAPSNTSYRWDATGQQWIYNWQTPSTAGNWWAMGVLLDDGQTYWINAGLR